MDISGKIALVTDAGGGIGRACAAALAAAGAHVLVADLDDIAGTETVRRIEEDLGARAAFVKVDLAYAHDVRTMFSAVETTYGGVDVVVNHAGLVVGEPVWPEADLERVARVVAANQGGMAMVTQMAIGALRARGGGCIVNTLATGESPPDLVREMALAALIRLTEGCARYGTEGIRVNAALPAAGTPGWLAAESVAAAVLALLADDASVAEVRLVPDP